MTTITRPEAGDIAPYAQIYVDCVPPGDVIQTLEQQIHKTITLLKSFPDEQAGTLAYAPGKWTVKEVIGHLSDTERIFSYRALRIARGDATPLPGFEQNDYVPMGKSNGRALESLLDELFVIRQSTLALFKSFSEDAWTRRGTVSNFSLTTRGIAFTAAGHELHHYRILQERYLPKR